MIGSLFIIYLPFNIKGLQSLLCSLAACDKSTLLLCLARTTVQKDDDFLITGHIGLGSRVPVCTSGLSERLVICAPSARSFCSKFSYPRSIYFVLYTSVTPFAARPAMTIAAPALRSVDETGEPVSFAPPSTTAILPSTLILAPMRCSSSTYLKRFDAISVREQKANDLCHHLGFEKSIVAIDPTLLLKSSDYNVLNNGMKKEGSSKPYAFIYLLNIRNSDEVYWDEFHKMIQENDLSVRVVASSGYLPAQDFLPGYQNEQATIPEWLSLIKHSEFVITTSFHGVVFCLLNHKPFYAVLLNNEFSKGNDRIISLLKTVGLEKRIVSSASDINSIKFVEINWDNVDEKLSKLRKESIDFLNKEL